MKKLAFISAGILAFALQNASAQYVTNVLYTTTSDFTGWSPNTTETVGSQSFSADSSIINGLGNNNPGSADTSGSLSITWSSGTYNPIAWAGTVPTWTQTFMDAIDPGGAIPSYSAASGYGPGSTVAYSSGILQMTYSVPDNEGGSFFQLGFEFTYAANGYYQPFFGTATDLGTTDPNGFELWQATIPYTITAGSGNLYGMGFAVFINSDYSPVLPFTVDQIQTLTPVPEPATMALVGLGTLGFAFLARRRA